MQIQRSMPLLVTLLLSLVASPTNGWPLSSYLFTRKLQQQEPKPSQPAADQGVLAVSAEEVLQAAASNLPSDAELQALQVKMLRNQVEQLPLKIEHMLSARLAEVLVKQIRSWVIDPTQAAVLNATLSGRHNPIGSRMVHFMGKDLLVVAPKNDEYVGAHILQTGTPFMPHMLGPMLDLIKLRPGSTVVDVGANIGSYSIFFAAMTGPKGRVYSFEPQRKMFQVLCANAIINGLLNVYPQNVALSFGAGVAEMSTRVPDGEAAGQDISRAEEQGLSVNYGGMSLGQGGEKVHADSLDSYNLTGVSLIKVDVQGAEKLVLYGARDTIRRNLPVVVYESQAGFTVSKEMNASMHIPDVVHAFNVSDFLLVLGYQPMPDQPSPDDIFWLPPNHELLQSHGLGGNPFVFSPIGQAAKGAADVSWKPALNDEQ